MSGRKENSGNGDPKSTAAVGAVMVVGGGIGGMQASLDLANAGFKVYLVDKSSSIGGRMAQLDKTFPTNDCSMCTISPKLIEVDKHLNIDLITYSEVEAIEGDAGNFTVKVRCKAKLVDYEKCTGCGICLEKCPSKVDSEFEAGIGKRKAIYVPYPQAVPNKPVIDREHCLKITKDKCGVCQKKCPVDAIDYEMQDEVIELNVGAVILAPGYDIVDPALRPEYGFGRYKNVITSLQYERFLSASGPTQGHIKRPSDGETPKKIAWVQCVGSRDSVCGNEYCSSVCCMYATKEAIMTAEHEKDAECTIFFNDIRAFGKGFERYYIGAEKESGVRYIRGIVSSVKEMQQTKNLLIRFASDDGEIKEEEFDLLVLSVGMKPAEGTKALAETVGIELDSHGYALASTFRPNESSRPGVFAAGAFLAPMDIPETVMTASSAAAAAGELVARERGTLVTEKTYPDEREIAEEQPRIGVFVCRCGTNIARVVDVPEVVEYAKTLPGVEFATESLFTCSTDSTRQIAAAIKEQNLNRVVVAACTPATHEPLFQDTLREAGLNKFLFEMANIRNQCSWVHEDPAMATEKSKDLVR
ncbi:MAG: FAD-dependent oxidoreductase, partial [Candidatus Abyssubacteria bacterium]|nr:FAD-dependent oxidoreductase [Candidatus Abyssubacteria bacterium]